MKKIFSSLLFSTATLGGVVGIVAQTNQASSGTVNEPSTSALQTAETTQAATALRNISLEEVSEDKEQSALSQNALQETKQSQLAPVRSSERSYEDVQSIRTGYKPVAPEIIEAQPKLNPEIAAEPSVSTVSISELSISEAALPSAVKNASDVLKLAVEQPQETPEEAVQPTVIPEVIATETQDSEPLIPVVDSATLALELTESQESPKEEVLQPTALPATEAPVSLPVTKDYPVTSRIEKPIVTTAPVSVSHSTIPKVEPVKANLTTESASIPSINNMTNAYPVGQCTWGVKVLAPWVGDHWGNAGEWAESARAAGYSVGTTPTVGAVAVWPKDGEGYGHVALVTSVESVEKIQVSEANYAGHQSISNYRGWFNPTDSMWGGGEVYYIYPSL